jgi:ribonuclease D
VFRNESLLELAVNKPVRLKDLETEKILSRKQIDRYGERLLREIHRAMGLPDGNLPVYPRKARTDLPSSARKRFKALRAWRESQAKNLGMEPGILINNDLMNAFALKNPRSVKEMEEIPGLKKWVQDHFGREILTA